MPKTKPAYTEQFKRDVLAYQASTGCSFKAAAVHFGVSANSMREWRGGAQAAPPGGPRPPPPPPTPGKRPNKS
jgi:transposase-like protein